MAVEQGSTGITVVDVTGVPLHRREHVEEAVIAGGSLLSQNYEAWVVPGRRPPGFKVRIIGPRGFYREIRFAGPETKAEIESHVRRAIEN